MPKHAPIEERAPELTPEERENQRKLLREKFAKMEAENSNTGGGVSKPKRRRRKAKEEIEEEEPKRGEAQEESTAQRRKRIENENFQRAVDEVRAHTLSARTYGTSEHMRYMTYNGYTTYGYLARYAKGMSAERTVEEIMAHFDAKKRLDELRNKIRESALKKEDLTDMVRLYKNRLKQFNERDSVIGHSIYHIYANAAAVANFDACLKIYHCTFVKARDPYLRYVIRHGKNQPTLSIQVAPIEGLVA